MGVEDTRWAGGDAVSQETIQATSLFAFLTTVVNLQVMSPGKFTLAPSGMALCFGESVSTPTMATMYLEPRERAETASSMSQTMSTA